MNEYTFVLGTAFDLCQAELASILKSTFLSPKLIFSSKPLVSYQFSNEIDPIDLITKLGGTIKIAKVIARLDTFELDEVKNAVLPFMNDWAFGFSVYSPNPLSISKLSSTLKEALHEKGISARYVLPKEDHILSSIVVKKQKIHEFILYSQPEQKGWVIAKTIAVQDSEDWAKRDYGRPYADSKSGMLPPKVARIMINLACSQFLVQSSLSKRTLLDPFCGMGTILQEGLLSNLNVIGSDVSEDVVKKTQKNLEWLIQEYQQAPDYRVFANDATHVSQKIQADSIDMIVTEPFLGAPFERRGETLLLKQKKVTVDMIHNQLKGLEKLYIGVLKDWNRVLVQGGIVALILPSINYEKREYYVKKPVDRCERLGYTLLDGPYTYSRPQAVVKRNIYVFEKVKVQNSNVKT